MDTPRNLPVQSPVNETKNQPPSIIGHPDSKKKFLVPIIGIIIIFLIGLSILLPRKPQQSTKELAKNQLPSSLNRYVTPTQSPSELIYNYRNQIATVFAIGGSYYDPIKKIETSTNSAEFYNFQTDKWSFTPPMNHEHEGAAAAVYGNKIYVFGGQEGNFYNGTAVVEEFNPESNRWTIKSDMPTPRFFAQAVSVAGKIYVMGGVSTSAVVDKSVDVYDPEIDSWQKASDIPITYDYEVPVCAPINNKIYCPGIGEHSYTLIYDPPTNTWSSIPTQNRINAFLPWSSTDYVMYAADFYQGNTILQYNPVNDTILTKPAGNYIHLSYQNYGIAAFNNFLLLIGGRFAARPVRDVYVYGLDTYTQWKKTTPLNIGRASAAVVLLPITYTGTAEDSTRGSIGGIVTSNTIPVPNKKIVIYTGQNFLIHTETFTDKNGRYNFISLAPGIYRITVEQDSPGEYSVPMYKGTQQVTLTNGEKITDYNYDLLKPTQY